MTQGFTVNYFFGCLNFDHAHYILDFRPKYLDLLDIFLMTKDSLQPAINSLDYQLDYVTNLILRINLMLGSYFNFLAFEG